MLRRLMRNAMPAIVLMLFTASADAAELIVSAAASLTNAFTELARTYEKANRGTSVVMNFGGSGQLLQQIDRGAPVDVFASADEETMDRAQQKQLIIDASRRDFAQNRLVLIAPADSKQRMRTLSDLRDDAIERIAISNPASVPVGRYSKLALQAAGLWGALDPKYINTQHVRQSLDYVARGEVDIGFVYATDARIMPERVKVLMEVPTTMPIAYPIAMVADTRQPQLAQHFIEFVKSAAAHAILRKHGFAAP